MKKLSLHETRIFLDGTPLHIARVRKKVRQKAARVTSYVSAFANNFLNLVNNESRNTL